MYQLVTDLILVQNKYVQQQGQFLLSSAFIHLSLYYYPFDKWHTFRYIATNHFINSHAYNGSYRSYDER